MACRQTLADNKKDTHVMQHATTSGRSADKGVSEDARMHATCTYSCTPEAERLTRDGAYHGRPLACCGEQGEGVGYEAGALEREVTCHDGHLWSCSARQRGLRQEEKEQAGGKS